MAPPAPPTPPAEQEAAPVELTDQIAALQRELDQERQHRCRLEGELAESEQRFYRSAELNPSGVVIHRHGLIVYTNPAARELFRAAPEDPINGRPIFDFVDGLSRQIVAERVRRMVTLGERVPLIEETFRRLDGSPMICEVSAMPASLRGEPAIMVVFRDISQRKRMTQSLAEERERLAITLRSIGDGVIATDVAGRVTLLNPVAEQLTGWTQPEALGHPLAEVFEIVNERTRQPVASPVDQVLATGGTVGLANDTLLIARDGTERTIADSGAPIRDARGELSGVVLVFRDQTEKKRLDEELRRAQKLDSLGLLAGGIAHDFNNILTAIFGNISLARALSGPDEPSSMRLLEAEKAIRRARDLTQQLLTFSRGGEPIRRPLQLALLIRETLTFALAGSEVRAELTLAPDLWTVEADEGQLGQVLHNLVLNAVQAMPGGGRLEVRARNVEVQGAEPHPLPPGAYVCLTVIDQGSGIPPRDLERIFDPYYTTKEQGRGLGLTVSFSIVRSHGGSIFVDSLPGLGSRFHVYLPASDRPARPASPAPQQVSSRHGRVLVMDDEATVREVAVAMLAHLGYQATGVRDGAEAVAVYHEARQHETPFDFVIVDLTVPGGLGGLETLQQLRRIDPAVRALVSSGYSRDPVMARYAEHGFCGVVSKPYRIEELGAALDEALGGPHPGSAEPS